MNPLALFYDKKEEPIKGCLLALQTIILRYDDNITTNISYGLPFFYYNKKRICYLWIDKKTQEPYVGFIDGHLMNHSALEKGDRKKVRIYPVSAYKDIDIEELQEILAIAISLKEKASQ